MKGKGCYKKGGRVKRHVENHEAEKVEHHHYKKGGKILKAHGEKAKVRMDKRARGGKIMTPSSPLSGAEPKGLPAGGGASSRPGKSND